MVNVLISSDPRYPVNRKVIRQAVADVFKSENIEGLDAEVSVLVCGLRKMRALSKQYMKDNKDHEVLSFPQEEINEVKGRPLGTLSLGDVVVCWPILLQLAAKENVLVDQKLDFLVSHAVMHLLGHHHGDDK